MAQKATTMKTKNTAVDFNITGKVATSQWEIDTSFKGYRNKEDKTNLAPGYLVEGSQNVVITTGNRISTRQGFILDGQADATVAGIKSAFDDFISFSDVQRPLRSGNGKLQYRYVDGSGNITWNDLITGLGDAVNFNYIDWWDDTEEINSCLMVNGTNDIKEWNGAITTLKSATWDTGIIDTIEVDLAGDGFSVGDVITISGAGNGLATAKVTALTFVSTDTPYFAAAIKTLDSTPTFGGTGYATNDTFSITSGDGNAWGKVVAQTGGVVTQVALLKSGSNYSTGTGKATTHIIGSGTGLTVHITDVTLTGVKTLELVNHGKSYSVADYITTNTAVTIGVTKVVQGSITKNGTDSWDEEGFYDVTTTKKIITINGNDYTYTSSNNDGTSIYGISSDPTGEAVDSLIVQKPYINSGVPVANFNNDLISYLGTQIYLASFTNRTIYISAVNSIDSYTPSSTRKVGEGMIQVIDSNPVAFVPQESDMYISAGLSDWYKTTFTLSSDNTKEDLTIVNLKATPQSGAQSQALISKMKNLVVFVDHEPVLNQLGRVESNDFNSLATPQSVNISDPIKNDFDQYDFTGGSVAYFQNFIYIAIPKHSIVMVYNIVKEWWESPWTMAISRFSIIDGQLYGHSSLVPETYKMLTGYNDNGGPIDAKAYFSYENYGSRVAKKEFDEYYVEGYIKGNTTLTCGVNYDLDGYTANVVKTLLGTNSQVVDIAVHSGTSPKSLGKYPLGKIGLGGSTITQSNLPPKFRVIWTMPKNPFYENQFYFESNQIDARWEILAFGPKVNQSVYGPTELKI